ncbi:hypothetical protein SAMN05216570_0259 [Dyella sp. OK004]|uniref:DUF5329 domain-containing protein n=1 Tax=Dyella sp. OK004 TaxID=1855292 RepID=UPI0008EB88AD|nr:DUF5329 domain-containing protein [Dyella sp. OK004]SFR88134.1 hypothetical protein SAMN05216570_0259 [Dyella sp. OK004]
MLALLTAVPVSAAHAALDAKGQQEVKALLAFVGNSHCTFIRNGSDYSATDAQAHLQKKFDYLARKDQVNSAEEFIERAGSESSLSGTPYKVSCDGREQLTGDWLREELERLRGAGG